MLRLKNHFLAVPIGVALVGLIALPMAVLGNTSGPIAQTGGMTVTLPLLGASLNVDVKLDTVGNVSSVALDPIGAGTGAYSATKVRPHAVTFTRADGATKVSIKAKGDKLSIKASAGTLADLSGSGTWSANVFGPGTPATVGYTIGAAADGSPTVAINSVVAPGMDVVQGLPKTETEDHEAKASVKVTFSLNGFTKKLSISVSVDTEDTPKASLKITLSGKDRQKLSGTLESLLGTHTWSGRLCDGTAVGITYNVLADGTVAFGAATGGTVTVKSSENGFSARFDGTKVKVKVRLKKAEDGTTYTIKVDAKTGKCKDTPAPLPTVNTPVAPGADQAGDHHDGEGDESDSHDGNGGGGKDGSKHDD